MSCSVFLFLVDRADCFGKVQQVNDLPIVLVDVEIIQLYVRGHARGDSKADRPKAAYLYHYPDFNQHEYVNSNLVFLFDSGGSNLVLIKKFWFYVNSRFPEYSKNIGEYSVDTEYAFLSSLKISFYTDTYI